MKKRFDRLLLCAVMICSLALPAGFADGEGAGEPAPEMQPPVTQEFTSPEQVTEASGSEPTREPATESTQEPASEPTQEPTQEPTSEPTQEPVTESTQEPTSESTQEPTSEPTQEPTTEPTQEPATEPTMEPTSDPTADPTAEPSADPSASPEPGASPLPAPGSIDGLVTITAEAAAQQENGVWRIQLPTPESPLSFSWTVNGDASAYLIYVQGGQSGMRFLTETANMRIDLSSAGYAKGQYTLYVGAVLADGSCTWGKITFEPASAQARPSGGGRPGGSRPGGSTSAGEMNQEEPGFQVTPGKALTSMHSSGTKNTAAYTHSEIAASGEATTALVLDSTQTEITLDDGAAFYVFIEGGELQLTPEAEGDVWELNALAMNTLAESGIERVVFHVGGTACELPAKIEFSGNVYASLRAKGYVSKDMQIRIDALGAHVRVDGCSYSLSDCGELVPCEE